MLVHAKETCFRYLLAVRAAVDIDVPPGACRYCIYCIPPYMQGLAIPGARGQTPHPAESAKPRAPTSAIALHKGETSFNNESLIRSCSPEQPSDTDAASTYKVPPKETCNCTSHLSPSEKRPYERLYCAWCEKPHHKPPHLPIFACSSYFPASSAQPFQCCRAPEKSTRARLVGPSFNPVAPARWSRHQGPFYFFFFSIFIFCISHCRALSLTTNHQGTRLVYAAGMRGINQIALLAVCVRP